MDDCLIHYGRSVLDGAKVGSGRYRRGSGDRPYQHDYKRIMPLYEGYLQKDFSRLKERDANNILKYRDANGKIKIGSAFERITSGTGDHPGKRYVTLTSEDKERYKDYADSLVKNGKPKIISYESVKPLRVAEAKEVAKYILKRDGNKDLYDLFTSLSDSTLKRIGFVSGEESFVQYLEDNGATKLKTELALRTANSVWDAWRVFKNNYHDKKLSDDMIQHFIQKGYDAIVDVEDFYDATMHVSYPLIVLKAEEALKKTGEKKI